MIKRRWFGGVSAVLFFVALLMGCREYPTVTSAESQDLIKLVYTASNTRSAERLAVCEERLAKLDSEGKIGPKEKAAFEKILQHARDGKWEEAQKDQVR